MEKNPLPQDVETKMQKLLQMIEVEVSTDWSVCMRDFSDVLSVDNLSKEMGMSVRSLTSYFKQYTNQSLAKYIAMRRAEYAARLFRVFPDVSTAKVSQINGFLNPPALYSFLKKQGIDTPSDLRKNSASSAKLSYRIEYMEECIMIFRLRYGAFDDCNSIEFENDNWSYIEDIMMRVAPCARPIGYVGMAVDNFMTDDETAGAFMSGILYPKSVELPSSKLGLGIRLMPGGKFAIFTHKGPYEELVHFYNEVVTTINNSTELTIEKASLFFEKYLNSPSDTPKGELITEIWVPLLNHN